MTQRALSSKQFFHGSPHDLQPGDEIKPPSVTGLPTNRGDGDPDKVYVTPHPYVAGQYTWKYGADGRLADDPKDGPSGHVYEVEPIGRRTHDPNQPRGMTGLSYATRAAKVVRKLSPEEWR